MCRATNELVKRGTKEVSMKLNVCCKSGLTLYRVIVNVLSWAKRSLVGVYWVDWRVGVKNERVVIVFCSVLFMLLVLLVRFLVLLSPDKTIAKQES